MVVKEVAGTVVFMIEGGKRIKDNDEHKLLDKISKPTTKRK